MTMLLIVDIFYIFSGLWFGAHRKVQRTWQLSR